MKIVHVSAGAEEANGAAVIAAGFARAQAAAGHEVVFVTTSMPEGTSTVDLAGVRFVVFRRSRLPLLRSWCFSGGMLRGLKALCADADVVHTHCQWTFPVWWASRVVPSGAKLVMTPEGSYDPVRLAFHAGRKRLAGVLDRAALRRADLLHATVPVEAEWIRAYEPGVRRVAVVPPGVTCVACPSLAAHEGPLRVLYLGRRHPLKGLDLLERAAEGLPVEVRLVSDAFGPAKEAQFDWCDVLCLPTRSENFGLVVAEALAHARPVIVTRGAPWPGVPGHGCGWWTDVSAAALRAALAEAASLPRAALAEKGARGQAWMAREYAWAVRAEELDRERPD